jgi:hypothetical protein
MHIREDVFSSLTAALGLSPQGGQWIRTGHAHHGHHHGEGTRTERAPSAEGENPIMQALAQALQSLGLSLSQTIPPTGTTPSATTGTTSSTAAATTTSASAATGPSAGATQSTPATSSAAATQAAAGTASNSTPAAAPGAAEGDDDGASGFVSVARDIRHLLHALFQDIRAENVLAPAAATAALAATDPAAPATVPASGTGTTTAAAPTSPFASGLAALISQVSSGSVPANLQNAFDKLVADLQQIGGVTPTSAASTGTAATSAPSAAASSTSTAASDSNATSASGSSATAASAAPANSPQSLLLKFLTTLQQDLGYGTAASTGSTTNGLVVNTVA